MLTNEQFWCPYHGRLPQERADVTQYDEAGGGPYVPYYKARCKGSASARGARRCGAEGAFVCDGTLLGCNLTSSPHEPPGTRPSTTLCLYHGCYVAPNPFPGGMARVKREAGELLSAQLAAQRRADNEMGLWHGDSEEEPSRGRGIFGGSR